MVVYLVRLLMFLKVHTKYKQHPIVTPPQCPTCQHNGMSSETPEQRELLPKNFFFTIYII